MKKQNMVAMILLVISAVIGACVWFFGTRPLYQQAESIRTEMTENFSSISENEERTNTVDGKAMVNAAIDKGEDVLAAWQAYLPTIEGLSRQEDLEAALAHQRELSDAIRACFIEGADVVIPFFSDDGTVGSNWRMETPYTFDQHGVNCIFTCKSDDGQLLAYVDTYYDAEADGFSSFNQIVTAYGYSVSSVTGSNGETEEELSAKQILDWAESNKVEPGRDMTDEEKADREEMIATRELQQMMFENGYIDNTGKLTEEGRKWVKQHPDESGPWAAQVENTEGGNAE